MATIRNDRDKLLQASTTRVEYNIIMLLSLYSATLAADSEGVVADNTKANTSVSLTVNTVDDIANWTLSVAGTGCDVHMSGTSVVFDGFTIGNTTDSCSYVVTATRSTFITQTATFQVVRARSGSSSTELALSPAQLILQADYLGDVPSYAGYESVAKLTTGFTDVTGTWTLSKEDSPGISSKLTGSTVSIINSANTSDSDCVYALDFDTASGTLTNATIIDSSIRRRKSNIGVDNGTYAAYFKPTTISAIGPAIGVKSAVFSSDGTGSSIIRSFNTTGREISHETCQTMQYSFSVSFYVSFDNASSTNLQTIYNTSYTNSLTSFSIRKAPTLNRIEVVNNGISGYTSNQVILYGPSTLANNTFYHIACNFNAVTRIFTLYIDGNSVATATIAGTVSTNYNACINLGSNPTNTANTGLNGKLALFKCWWNTEKYTSNFNTNTTLVKYSSVHDSLSSKTVLAVDFSQGSINDITGNKYTLSSASGAVSYNTDADGTGAIISGAFLETGLLSSLKLTGPYCIEMRFKCLSGYDFAEILNTPTAILQLVDKNNSAVFEMRLSNPGALGGSAWSSASMPGGYAYFQSSTLTVVNTVYHAMVRMGDSSDSNLDHYMNATFNGQHVTSNGPISWSHGTGIDAYKLRIGNIQANKGSKLVVYWIRITSGNYRYDYDFAPPSSLETILTSGYVDVFATKAANTLTKRLSISKQLAGAPNAVMSFDPVNALLSSDAYGWVRTLPSTNVAINVGSASDYGNWSTSITTSSGAVGTLSASTLAINSLTSTYNVQTMLQGEGFFDVSENRRTVTAAASGSATVPTIATDWSPWGGAGNHYKFVNASNNQQYMSLAPGATTMHISTSDFTLEFMFSTDTDPTAGTFMVPFWNRGTGNELYGSDLSFIYDSTNKWRVSCSPNYSDPFGAGTSSTVLTFATAPDLVRYKSYHIALVRSGTTIYLFINGTRYAASASLAGGFSFYNTNQTLYIGYRPTNTYVATMRFAQIRFTIGYARYTAGTITPPTGPFVSETVDTGYLELTATKTGFPNIVKQFSYSKIKSAVPTKQAQTGTLSKTLIQLSGDNTGHIDSANYVDNIVTAIIYIGGVDDTANWTFTRTSSTGITTTISGPSVTLTALTDAVDSGYIDIVAQRSGWTDITMRCSVAKTRVLLPVGQVVQNNNLGTVYAYGTGTVTASLVFQTDGRVYNNVTGLYVPWYNPTTTSIGASYHITVYGLGPTTANLTGALNTSYKLDSNRTWSLSISAAGDDSFNLGFTIRADAAGVPGAVVGSGTAVLAVHKEGA